MDHSQKEQGPPWRLFKPPKLIEYGDRNMPEFSAPMMNRLIRKTAKVRVSRSAALELSAVLEEYAIELSKEAIKLTKHRSAKTVNESDILAAASRIRT